MLRRSEELGGNEPGPEAPVPRGPAGVPPISGATQVLALQRQVGNHAVASLLAGQRPGIRRIARLITAQQAIATFQEVGRLPGVQAEKVFNTIRECGDRAALRADPTVQSFLTTELSGHELWHAQLLLQYGTEAAYPPAIRELWAATEGAAHDRDRAFRALQALTPAQIRDISAVPGLRNILAEFGTASERHGTTDLLSGDYAQARQRHVDNVAMVNRVIAGMLAGPAGLYRNTGQVISPARPGARPRIAIKVCTPTHDAAHRAAFHGHHGKFAYFGCRDIPPRASADYDVIVDSERNIDYELPPSQADGWNDSSTRTIRLMDPLQGTETYLRDVLITHEVQHGLDRHEDEAGGHDDPNTSVIGAWNHYKTEFRAYWVTNEYDAHSTRRVTAAAPWRSDKQYAIFNHMYRSTTYAWLAVHYDANAALPDGRRFKDVVQQYATPEGVNLINSARIDDFYDLLGACQPVHRSVTTPPVSDLVASAGRFDAGDRAHVNSSEGWRMQGSIIQRLHWGALLVTGRAMNDGVTIPDWAMRRAAIDATVRRIFLNGTAIRTEAEVLAAIRRMSPTERALASNSAEIDLAITVFLPADARPRVRPALGPGTSG